MQGRLFPGLSHNSAPICRVGFNFHEAFSWTLKKRSADFSLIPNCSEESRNRLMLLACPKKSELWPFVPWEMLKNVWIFVYIAKTYVHRVLRAIIYVWLCLVSQRFALRSTLHSWVTKLWVSWTGLTWSIDVCAAFAASFLIRIARLFPYELNLKKTAKDIEELASVLSDS